MEGPRVLVVGKPRLLFEIVAELAARGLAVVEEPDDYEAALHAIARSGADVVVTSREGAVCARVGDLLAELPFLRVLAISADASESSLYELRPHERLLGEISPKTLLAAIGRRLAGDADSSFEIVASPRRRPT